MAAVNSQYNASSGGDDVPVKPVAFTGSNGKIPTLVDYNAFASSGTTLAIANKPPLLGDRKIQLPNIPVDVDWALNTNQGATLCLKNKPTFASVASSGSYADLSNKPALAAVALSGQYSDLTGVPASQTITTLVTAGMVKDRLNTLVTANGAVSYATTSFPTLGLNYPVTSPSPQGYLVYQGWHYSPTATTIPANAIQFSCHFAMLMVGYTYVDTRSGFGGGASNMIFGVSGSTPFPGSSNLTSNVWNYTDLGFGTAIWKNSAYSIPAGVTEFRLAFMQNPANVQPAIINLNSISNGLLYQNLTQASLANATASDLGISGTLTMQYPRTWYWYYNGFSVAGPQSTYILPSSAWTLVAPSGSPNVMSSSGVITVPTTGVYALTLATNWNATGSATANHRLGSDDGSLGPIGTLMFAETLDCAKVDHLQSSCTVRLTAGSTLTPNLNFSAQAILYGSQTNPSAHTRLMITLLFAC